MKFKKSKNLECPCKYMIFSISKMCVIFKHIHLLELKINLNNKNIVAQN